MSSRSGKSSGPGAMGGRLDPVLAGRRAEPAGAVAGHVDVPPVALGRRADTEPVGVLAAQDGGERGRERPGPAVGEVVVAAVEVHVPGLAVVLLEERAWAQLVQQG